MHILNLIISLISVFTLFANPMDKLMEMCMGFIYFEITIEFIEIPTFEAFFVGYNYKWTLNGYQNVCSSNLNCNEMFIWSCCVWFQASLLHIRHSCMMWLDFATYIKWKNMAKLNIVYVFCSIGNSLKPINNYTCHNTTIKKDNNVIMY
eukprot:UN12222